jgi:HNH endonuclease
MPLTLTPAQRRQLRSMTRLEKLGWDPASIALGFARGAGLTLPEAMAFASKVMGVPSYTKGVSGEEWDRICRLHRRRCAFCDGRAFGLAIAYVRPLDRGGKDDPSNTAPICFDCSRLKGSRKLHPDHAVIFAQR